MILFIARLGGQCREQVRSGEWFAQVAVCTERKRQFTLAEHTADEDFRRWSIGVMRHQLEHFPAVLAGEHDVEKDGFRSDMSQSSQGGCSVVCGMYAEAVRGEIALVNLQHVFVVVDGEDGAAGIADGSVDEKTAHPQFRSIVHVQVHAARVRDFVQRRDAFRIK